MRKIKQNKYGLQENPMHYHVCMVYKNKKLLGEVIGFYRNVVTNSVQLKINHFNGDPWIIDPVISMVEILE